MLLTLTGTGKRVFEMRTLTGERGGGCSKASEDDDEDVKAGG